MPIELIVLLLFALGLSGAVAGVVAVLRRRITGAEQLEANPLVPRVSAEVHAGEEQVLIHLARSLALPTDRDGVGYGEVYIAGSAGATMKLASRSEIGRGFDGEVRVHRNRRASVAEYYILRLPGDETVLQRIAALDDQVASALRGLDPAAHVRLAGEKRGLQGFEPTTR